MLKSRDITLPTKVRLVKALGLPVVLYGCERWTIKKAECRRIDAFELWCWKRLWESLGLQGDPTSPFLSKSVPNTHWKDWCWNWNCKTLGHLMRKTGSLEKTLTLGKIEGRRRRGQQRMRWLDGVTDGMYMSLSRIGELITDRGAWCAAIHGVAKSRIRLSNWT